jgi:hypothetical protein
MPKKLDMYDQKRSYKVPIFKEDIEFELFYAKHLQQIENDNLNLQKAYFNKVSKELSVIDKKERVFVLENIILKLPK